MDKTVGASTTVLDEPRIYLSRAQAEVCAKHQVLQHLVLPGWVSQRLLAEAFGHPPSGIENALNSTQGEPWLWATEFENVHSTWKFAEPRLVIDGHEYTDSETYYHSQKPQPFDAELWKSQRVGVMRKAVAAKFAASDEARALLLASHPHRLLSVKPDAFWGFHPVTGGENMLAVLLMELRDGYVSAAEQRSV